MVTPLLRRAEARLYEVPSPLLLVVLCASASLRLFHTISWN